MNERRKEICRKYRENNPEKVKSSYLKYQNKPESKIKSKEYYLANQERYFANKVKRKLGMTIGEYKEMEDLQSSKCAICAKPETKLGHTRLCVDHDHTTGLVRALLCSNCNLGIGHFREDITRLKAAVEYLKLFGKKI